MFESGKFYFIKDEYFELFKEYNLMQNKDNGNKRPCYFCFRDFKNSNIIWFVPISSKIEKYKKLFEEKKLKNKKVYNFVFGKVLGKEKVFLIQNIFPVTEKYIEEKYKNKNQDVEISPNLKKEIIKTATTIIKMSMKGINIPFYDIITLKEILIKNEI